MWAQQSVSQCKHEGRGRGSGQVSAQWGGIRRERSRCSAVRVRTGIEGRGRQQCSQSVEGNKARGRGRHQHLVAQLQWKVCVGNRQGRGQGKVQGEE